MDAEPLTEGPPPDSVDGPAIETLETPAVETPTVDRSADGEISNLDGAALAAVAVTYHRLLDAHRRVIDQLNVYPVPDGDTGTNMSLTLSSVVAELDGCGDDLAEVCRAIGHGSLMGARGNSGVILSQILRGLTTSFADAGHVDAAAFASALTAASVAADAAVGRPTEGTILTVCRDAAGAASEAADRGAGLLAVLDAAHRAAGRSLAGTPDLLPVLAQAGVVDAGGSGLVLLFDATLHVLDGRALPDAPAVTGGPSAVTAGHDAPGAATGRHDADDLRYEVMYLLEAPDAAMGAFRDVWAGMGDSIVVVGGDGLWNCHIHTDDIGPTIEAALDIGRPRQIRVTDLADQVEELAWVRAGEVASGTVDGACGREPVDCVVVAVSPAEGIGRIFHSLGVQRLVPGGQTMNPSTQELLEAIEGTEAPEVVLLPNNANIVPVARQAAAAAGPRVQVVPTTSVVAGFAALMAYDPMQPASANTAAMAEASAAVITAEVTQAVRTTSSAVGPVAEGDWLGLDASGIRSIADAAEDAAIALLDALVADGHELVTIITGEGATEAATRRIAAWVSEHRGGVEVETHRGGQAHYPFLFGIE